MNKFLSSAGEQPQAPWRYGPIAVSLGINSFASLLFETILLKQLGFLMGSWSYILSIVLCSFMAGAGLGALLAMVKKIALPLGVVSVLQGVSVIAISCILLKFDTILNFSNNLVILGLILSPCFILFGYFVTCILEKVRNERPGAIGMLYAADLLGAAAGGILSVFIILPVLGVSKATLVCVLLFGAAAFLVRQKRLGTGIVFVSGTAAAFITLLLFSNIDPVIEKHREITHTPLHALLAQGNKLLYSGWSPLHRIDVLDNHSNLTVVYNGFPWTSFAKLNDPVTVDSMLKDLHARYLKGLFPFLHNPRRTLIIGAGAGPDVFYAKIWLEQFLRDDPPGDSGAIVGVEIDPLVVDLMKKKFNAFNRNVFNEPPVTIINDDGRHFLATTAQAFDLIHYPGVDTPYAYTNALGINPYLRAENYLYTFEGLRSAYERLSKNGALIITVGSWFPESIGKLDFKMKLSALPRESRLIATMKMILESRGITRWYDYMEVVAYAFQHGDDNSMIDTMIKVTKRPVDAALTRQAIARYGHQSPVYIFDTTQIVTLATLSSPITDDRPFYYNFPLNAVPSIITKPLVFFSTLLIASLVCIFFVLMKRTGRRGIMPQSLLFIFFACCGISYMIAELLFAQQATVFLGNSFVGAALLIPVFLLWGGLGSYLADTVLRIQRWLYGALLIVPLYNYVLPSIISSTRFHVLGLPLYLKTIFFALLVLPLGFPLGILFPAGFILSSRLQPRASVPLIYTIDIIGSIVGILVGVSLPLAFGYTHSIYFLSGLLFAELLILNGLVRSIGTITGTK